MPFQPGGVGEAQIRGVGWGLTPDRRSAGGSKYRLGSDERCQSWRRQAQKDRVNQFGEVAGLAALDRSVRMGPGEMQVLCRLSEGTNLSENREIPIELVGATRERRLIPFIGAGLSSSIGLPRWNELLERVALTLPSDIPFDDLSEMCGHDPLRIAEYLYLVAGKEIGPIRHRISQELLSGSDPTSSGSHVELSNLGARRIYTTNYDDLIEQTFVGLDEPHDAIATPRHVAQASGTSTEIVKFHGDLQWEQTLVLTESSYHERLTFESPLDVKFRSDLLGNSVLFVGYGLGDLNIRIIWHRLMKMMGGVDPAERPRSFIIRLEANAAREALDGAAGIATICLDDARFSPESRVARFLMDLSLAAFPDGDLPGSGRPMFFSTELIAVVSECLESLELGAEPPEVRTSLSLDDLVDQVARRRIPGSLRSDVETLLTLARATTHPWADELLNAMLPNYAGQFHPDSRHGSVSVRDSFVGEP